jgi:hypothetical protein
MPAAPRICGGPDAGDGLGAADHVLSLHMAAGFRRHLILQQNPGKAGGCKASDGPLHIHGIAVPVGG